MRSPDAFDAFYKTSRDRLLLQTYALTGDLPAARSSVRDAFVAAWHHWRKVGRKRDPEAWLRPNAWAQAQRRHTARPWHRDKTLDPELRATLDALGTLTHQQRRILLLSELAKVSTTDAAREIGLTQVAADRLLESAETAYTQARESDPSQTLAELQALSGVLAGTPFPRATIIRRAGTARRRLFTGAGIIGTALALVGTGFFVTDNQGVAPSLEAQVVSGSTIRKPEAAAPRLDDDSLLTSDQAARLSPAASWQSTSTTDNSEGDGIYNACQRSRLADSDALEARVRTFRGKPKSGDPIGAVQATELSRTSDRADEAFTITTGWYGGCTSPHTQLLSTYAVGGVGDEARIFLLRTWGASASTLTVGVARTGQIVTTTVRRTPGSTRPTTQPVALFLAAGVNRLCGTPGAGTCAGPPTVKRVAPIAIGEAPGMLDQVDLARPGKVSTDWTASKAVQADQNIAALVCDDSDFSKSPVSNGLSRSFLMRNPKLPARFGMDESVGTLPSSRRAQSFVDRVRKRMANCEDKNQGSEVTTMVDRSGKTVEVAAWHIVTEINDDDTVDVLMAVVRSGYAVAEIGFVTANSATFDRPTFVALAERAAERLIYMPKPKP